MRNYRPETFQDENRFALFVWMRLQEYIAAGANFYPQRIALLTFPGPTRGEVQHALVVDADEFPAELQTHVHREALEALGRLQWKIGPKSKLLKLLGMVAVTFPQDKKGTRVLEASDRVHRELDFLRKYPL